MQHSSKPFSRFLAIPLLAGIAARRRRRWPARVRRMPRTPSCARTCPRPTSGPRRTSRRMPGPRAARDHRPGPRARGPGRGRGLRDACYRRAMTHARHGGSTGTARSPTTSSLLYQVELYQGALFSRLTARDGEPLDARVFGREQETALGGVPGRYRRSGGSRRSASAKRAPAERDQVRRRADRPVHGQAGYGVRDLRNRPSLRHLVRAPAGEAPGAQAHRPRPEQVAGRGLDRHGTTCEIARVSFQLMDRVRLWWGILGSISDATGSP